MKNDKDNKNIIIGLLSIVIIILLVLIILLAKNVISFGNKDNNVDNDNDSEINKQLLEDEEKGLALYKTFVGNGTGPFVWENEVVVNYEEIMSRMTNEYKNSESEKGYSIPVYENGVWKNYGGYGTAGENIFKDIKMISKDTCKIHYEITYTSSFPSTHEESQEFVVKTNSCSQDDIDKDFSNGYKVDKFTLVYGLKFE